jgi:hypothetical protein
MNDATMLNQVRLVKRRLVTPEVLTVPDSGKSIFLGPIHNEVLGYWRLQSKCIGLTDT